MISLPRPYSRTLLPLALLIGLILAAYAHLAFTDRILARGDTFTYFYPYWEARSAAFRVGTLPLWSSDLFMGVPLLANSQLGTFYPPNWAVTPFSAPDAIKISVIAHVLWAAIGVYVLARRGLHLSRAAAFTSALIFALGGVIGAHVEQINQLQGLSWMGWLFWCLHETTYGNARRRSLFTLMLAAGIALQFLSGHTQTVFITGLGLGIVSDGIVRSMVPMLMKLLRVIGVLAFSHSVPVCCRVVAAVQSAAPTHSSAPTPEAPMGIGVDISMRMPRSRVLHSHSARL